MGRLICPCCTIDSLCVLGPIQKHPHRKIKSLSCQAKNALTTKKLSRAFWRRFEAKHPSISRKRQGTVSINRALNCSREMAVNHIDNLALELIRLGIFTNASKTENRKWTGTIDVTRVYNHDETPQFINYGVDGTPRGLVCAVKGEECKKMVRENRECVTINLFVSFDDSLDLWQVVFNGSGINSHMDNPKI